MTPRRHFAPEVLAAGILTAGVIAVFHDALAGMVAQWAASPMYSHAYAVPLISLGLLWSRRHRFQACTPSPSPCMGASILSGALALALLGQVAAVQIVQQLAFLGALAGAVLVVFGWQYLRIAAPALGYLLFMVPFWESLTSILHTPFQHYSALMGTAGMRAVQVPVVVEGTFIRMPNLTLEVARACSGVNYLVAVLALALPLAFTYLRAWWRRVLLVSAALVVAALANGVRVMLIGTLAYLDVGSPLHGPFHILHGVFVAAVGYVMIFVGLFMLEERRFGRPSLVQTAREPSTLAVRSTAPLRALAVATVLSVLAVIGTETAAVSAMPRKSLASFPTKLGHWTSEGEAQDRYLEVIDVWSSSAHERLVRRYRDSERVVDIGIWYYTEQRQDRELVTYKADALHEGAQPTRITSPRGEVVNANVVLTPDVVGLFWYEFNGVPVADRYAAKLRTTWSALVTGRSDGAVIVLTIPARGQSRDDAVRRLGEFAIEVRSGLAAWWPVDPTEGSAGPR